MKKVVLGNIDEWLFSIIATHGPMDHTIFLYQYSTLTHHPSLLQLHPYLSIISMHAFPSVYPLQFHNHIHEKNLNTHI